MLKQKILHIIKQKKKKGFTLIELLLSVGIIAVLAGIVIVAVNPGQQFIAAVDAQRSSESREIKNAISQYTIEESVLPQDIPTGEGNALPICKEGIDPTINNCVDLSGLTPDFIVEIPEDPGELDPAITGYSVYKNSGNLVTVATDNQGEKSFDIDIVTDGLIAWWKSDDGSNTTVSEIINGYDGTLFAGDTDAAWSSEVAPNLFTNDGSISYLRANNPRVEIAQAPFRLQNFAYSFWTYSFDSGCNIAADMTNHANIRIGHFGGTYANRITFTDETVTLSGPAVTNQWKHIVFSYDGSTVKFFIDGSLVDSQDKTGTINYSGGSQPYLIIGNTSNPGFCSFDGYLDDFRFYDRGLTNQEVKRIANGTG